MYPIRYEADYKRQPDRLSTFFRIILVIPWAIVAIIYSIALTITALIAWLAVIILGRYPQGLYDFNAGMLRFFTRVNAFCYLQTDHYPPFGLGEAGDYPVRAVIAPRPERQSRLKALFRVILALPLIVVSYPISFLLQGAWVISWLTIVFRGYQPEGIHYILAFANAWNTRVGGYLLLLTDAYPPVGEDPLKQSPEAIEPPESVGPPEAIEGPASTDVDRPEAAPGT